MRKFLKYILNECKLEYNLCLIGSINEMIFKSCLILFLMRLYLVEKIVINSMKVLMFILVFRYNGLVLVLLFKFFLIVSLVLFFNKLKKKLFCFL